MPTAPVNMLVPTRVGMILGLGIVLFLFKACPHTRGDDPTHLVHIDTIADLSPHAWG